MLVSVFLTGCAGRAANSQPARSSIETTLEERSLPIPEQLREKVSLSEELGGELYINDKMAAIGTDVMLENVNDSQKESIRGYIVSREGNEQGQPTGSWLVEFFVDETEPKIGYMVHIKPPPTAGRATTQFEVVNPPRKPTDVELIVFRSIRTALAAVPDRPNQVVNPVVMPAHAIGEEGLLVYLLAATKQDNVVVMGKHYRVLVSNDGQKANKVEPLTKTVLETQLTSPKPGTKPVFLWVTHLLSEYPLETHVFISRLHHLPLFVTTKEYTWCIYEGKIKLVSLASNNISHRNE
jgi:hypothetical protein